MSANRLPLLTTIALAIIAAVLAVLAVMRTAELFQPVTIELPEPVAESPAARTTMTTTDLALLLQNPLFGAVDQPAKAEQSSADNVRESRLNIKLLGVVAGDNGNGVAVLAHDGKVRSYRSGDALDMSRKVTLHSVYPMFVLIEHGGIRERIALKNKPGANKGIAQSGKRSPQRNTGTNKLASQRSVNLRAPAIQSLVGDVRETITQSPLKLVRYMTAQPWSDDQHQGYRIQSGIDKRLLPYIGLRSGDVILAVNDKPIREIDISQVNSLVNSSDRFSLRVLRDGRQIGVNLDL